jgi:hypothetical protein
MKHRITCFSISICLVLPLFASGLPALAESQAPQGTMAYMPPPEPPAENPYPPQSAEDKRRVAFAEQVIQSQLRNIAELHLGLEAVNLPPFQNKQLPCLKDSACYGKDLAYVRELQNLQRTYGQALEVRHAHIIPWYFQKFLGKGAASRDAAGMAKISAETVAAPMSAPQLRPDEYMIHAYVKFSNSGNWNHLDVILTEDASGQLAFRHFYTIPMATYGQGLPPGVVC